MRAAIVGAAGMLGRKLAASLAAEPRLGGDPVIALTLADVVSPPSPGGAASVATRLQRMDLTDAGAAAAELVANRPDVIFHLAAVVSGQAEADFELGLAVNVDGTRALLEAVRRAGEDYRPRLVFASSLAVFGGPYPRGGIPDDFAVLPQTSYGTEKAIGELLLGDYSRRGYVDGIALRLPTICVRPGPANTAASGFLSGIIREPLAGQPAQLPVPMATQHWLASPRAAIRFLRHAAGLPAGSLGHRRTVTMPGLTVSVGEQVRTLRRVAGAAVARRIEHRPDPAVAAIVGSWPRRFTARHAAALGFVANASFEEIVREYIADELHGDWVR